MYKHTYKLCDRVLFLMLKFSDYVFLFVGDAQKILETLKGEDSPLRVTQGNFFTAGYGPQYGDTSPLISYGRPKLYYLDEGVVKAIIKDPEKISAQLSYTRGDTVTTADDIKNIERITNFLVKKGLIFFVVTEDR